MIYGQTPHIADGADEDFAFHLYGSSCTQVRLIEPYVSSSLGVRERASFELHLFSCERCLRAVEFELLVKRAVADFAKFAHFSRSLH